MIQYGEAGEGVSLEAGEKGVQVGKVGNSSRTNDISESNNDIDNINKPIDDNITVVN